MTTALCFNCGETKFGAWCPCGKCGVASSGNPNLDILFSDHRMSVATLERFGGIIKQIADRCDDPAIRYWVFMSYVSSHPAQLLSATPPTEIADRVEDVLANLQLPFVSAEIKPPEKDTGPPLRRMAVPESLLRRFIEATRFFAIQRVQVRRRDGAIVNGTLADFDGTPQFMLPAEIEMISEDIVAIRTAPGCLIGWVVRPKWTEVE